MAVTLGDVCAKYGAAYINRYGHALPVEQRRVLQLIADCGTGQLGAASYRCAECDAIHHTHASCGNRHCPGCQTANNAQWCVAQTQKLLPCEYFFATFTIPSELRRFVRSQQRVCYRAMFAAAAFALKTVLADPKFCGADTVGFKSLLHTFGRDLSDHPPRACDHPRRRADGWPMEIDAAGFLRTGQAALETVSDGVRTIAAARVA